MRKRVLFWVVFLLLSVCGFFEWQMFAAKSESPNFLFITIDTLRRDRFGAYGSVVPGTPNIDALAEKGTIFDFYYSAANCTTPSHVSMFSGKLPSTFKIFDNEKYNIAPRTQLITNYLRKSGYKTFGVSAAFFLGPEWLSGFGNTFDRFVRPPQNEFKAKEITAEFQKLIPDLKKGKFFCWLHFYDPHSPYDPPPEYKQSWDVDGRGGVPVKVIDDDIDMSWMKSYGLTRTWQARGRYRGEVAYTDAQVGQILKLLKENSLNENTVIIVVADHGEALGDRGLYYTHHGLYEPTIHVPFIVYGKGFKKGHVREFTSGVDIAPTILELAGIKPPDDMEGMSAVPLLQGETPVRDRLIYSISAGAVCVAVLKPPYKMIFNKSESLLTPELELYDVLHDRYERRNKIKSHPEIADEIVNRANPYIFGVAKEEYTESKMTEEDRERLRSLGYIQ